MIINDNTICGADSWKCLTRYIICITYVTYEYTCGCLKPLSNDRHKPCIAPKRIISVLTAIESRDVRNCSCWRFQDNNISPPRSNLQNYCWNAAAHFAYSKRCCEKLIIFYRRFFFFFGGRVYVTISQKFCVFGTIRSEHLIKLALYTIGK